MVLLVVCCDLPSFPYRDFSNIAGNCYRNSYVLLVSRLAPLCCTRWSSTIAMVRGLRFRGGS